jgi:hypothetical protein
MILLPLDRAKLEGIPGDSSDSVATFCRVRSVLPLPFLSLGVALVTAGALTGVALTGLASPGAGGPGVVTPPPRSTPVVTPEAGSPRESVAATTVVPSGALSPVSPAVLPTDVSSEAPNAENPRSDLGA